MREGPECTHTLSLSLSAEVEAGDMRESCLEKARQVREEMEKIRSASHHHHSHCPHSVLSAEKLLLLEALDMVCRKYPLLKGLS